MSTEKWSAFGVATTLGASDEVVGLQGGVNKRFPQSVVGGGILQKTVTLTNAQIKAIPSAAPQILAAPGANKITIVLGGITYFNFAVDYVNPHMPDSPSQLALGHLHDGTGKIYASDYLANADISLISGTIAPISSPHTSQDTVSPNSRTSNASSQAYVVNKPIVLYDDDNDGGADYTGGDAANVLTITLLYVVLDV